MALCEIMHWERGRVGELVKGRVLWEVGKVLGEVGREFCWRKWGGSWGIWGILGISEGFGEILGGNGGRVKKGWI